MVDSERRLGREIGPVLLGVLLLAAGWVYTSGTLWQLLGPYMPPERVEQARAGYGISFPGTWETIDPAMPEAVTWWDPGKVDDVAEYHRSFRAEGGILMARQALPPAENTCVLYDATEWASGTTFLGVALSFTRSLADDPGVVDYELAPMDLPGSPAVCVDALHVDGMEQREYVVSDGERWFRLSCLGHPAPDDRWLSIAETFEFLSNA